MEPPSSQITIELIDRVLEADEEAGDQLVEFLYPTIIRIVRNNIRRTDDHEDLVQEIYIRIFLKLEQYRGPNPFLHWASRLAITTCYDWLRKRQSRPLRSFGELSEAEAEIVERSLQGTLSETSEAQQEILDGLLDKLIAHLKPREQIVIRLLDLEEHSIREISEITGWSASKIKSIASRARKRLSTILQELEQQSQPQPPDA